MHGAQCQALINEGMEKKKHFPELWFSNCEIPVSPCLKSFVSTSSRQTRSASSHKHERTDNLRSLRSQHSEPDYHSLTHKNLG